MRHIYIYGESESGKTYLAMALCAKSFDHIGEKSIASIVDDTHQQHCPNSYIIERSKERSLIITGIKLEDKAKWESLGIVFGHIIHTSCNIANTQ